MKNTLAGVGVAVALAGGGTLTADQLQNPYTDVGGALEIKAESAIANAGENRVLLEKDRPAVTLSKWDGAANMTVSYDKVKALGARAFLTDKMEWKDTKEEVHAYPIQARIGMEDGAFEIEVILLAKPDTNAFAFALSGTEDLDFFYQPPLTAAEMAAGTKRPDDVVGSYAVYHRYHANYKQGDTNYATGKAYHIYRPKAVDALGNEQWAELSYATSTLTVTVPQSFLDKATYPVRVDPTFGYTTIGATDTQLCGSAINSTRRGAQNVYSGGSATLDKISMAEHSDSDVSRNIDTTVFINLENTVTDSLTQVAKIESLLHNTTGVAAFYDYTASGQALSNNNYSLNAICDSADVPINNHYIRTDTGSSINQYSESNASYATLRDESPWTETDSAGTTLYSIYATYTASGSAAPIKRQTVFDDEL